MTGKIYWRCYHCGEDFTKSQEKWARLHFGADESAEPVCLMRVEGEHSLLNALRKAENELNEYRNEDNSILNAMYGMQGDRARALREEEEKGYNKGVRDARKEQASFCED